MRLFFRAAVALGVLGVCSFGCGGAAPPPAVERADAPSSSAAKPQDPCDRGMHAIVASLREPMRIDIYVSSDLSDVGATLGAVRRMLDTLARESGGKIAVRTVWVKDEASRAEAEAVGLQAREVSEGDDATRQSGFFGLGLRYREESEALPLSSAMPGLRFWLISKIRELRDRADGRVRIGVLTGTEEIALGEPNLIPREPGKSGGPSIQSIIEQAMPFYELVPVDLRGGTAPIDPTLAGLVVTQPGRDLTDAELRRIDEFLLRGGKSAALFASAVNLQPGDASMTATLDTHGLERLLDGYGIEMANEVVLDWGSPVRFRFATPGGQAGHVIGHGMALVRYDEDAPAAQQTLDPTFAGFYRMDELAFPFPSPLLPHPERQPEAIMRVVARSTPRTTVDGSATVALKYTTTPRPFGEAGPRVLALALEGKLRGAFDSSRSAAGRLLVVSSSQFFANPYARAGNAPLTPQGSAPGSDDVELQFLSQFYVKNYLTASILSCKNILDWMTIGDDLITCVAGE